MIKMCKFPLTKTRLKCSDILLTKTWTSWLKLKVSFDTRLKVIAHGVRNFRPKFSIGKDDEYKKNKFFRIPHPFLSKCMLRMRKRRKSNLIQIFFMKDESFGGSV